MGDIIIIADILGEKSIPKYHGIRLWAQIAIPKHIGIANINEICPAFSNTLIPQHFDLN